jgi:hypothetical protein
MTEKEIADKAIRILASKGYLYWRSHKKAFYPVQDIFGIFDIVAYQGFKDKVGSILFIQLTTKDHISHRQNKIHSYFKMWKVLPPPYQIWGWDGKNNQFIIR